MNSMLVRAVLLWFALAVCLTAAVAFDPLFSPGMVIQRDVPLRLTGTGPAGGEVVVSINEAISQTVEVGADGGWKVEFAPMPAGGPHIFKASDANSSAVVDDVLTGDVWLCSGQSNMQMMIREVDGGPAALAAAGEFPEIRIFTVPRSGANEPKLVLNAKWLHRTVDEAGDFSAVAWFFANHLKSEPSLAGVSLGIINSSFGGTAIEAWMPVESLANVPREQISGSMFGIPSGALYNGMIAPLTRLPIKGVVWYQGESNAGKPQAYAGLLESLMHRWRTAWMEPELPFFIVQLPSFDGRIGGYDFSWLREAQAAACARSPEAWLAVAFDTTDGRDLHPKEKEEIGRRLALLARRNVYESKVIASGPEVQQVKVGSETIRVEFQGSDGLATRDSQPPAGFDIAGEDGEYFHADPKLDGSTMELKCPEVAAPQTVRYAWSDMPAGNLVNRSGLPVAPFRTDTMDPQKASFQTLPVIHRVQTPLYQLTTGDNGQITSLVVRGKQFLSNEPNGGTCIPDIFGARNLPQFKDLGPRRLRMFDGTGALEIVAHEESLEWMIRNDREREIEFQIILSPLAKVDFDNGIATISRDEVTVRIHGINEVKPERFPQLVVKVSAHSSAEVKIDLAPK